MSREQRELQQHQGDKCSFGWYCMSRQSLPSSFVPVWFQYSCAVTSPEACCSSWTCIVTWPPASNLNVMVFKLALVEWKPWQVQKMLTEEKWPWRVWYEDTVKGLIAPHASCKVHSCLPCPASLFGAWFREMLSSSDSLWSSTGAVDMLCTLEYPSLLQRVQDTFSEMQRNPPKWPVISQEKL